MRRRQARRTNDEAGIRAVELQPGFNTIIVCLVENTKDIKMFRRSGTAHHRGGAKRAET